MCHLPFCPLQHGPELYEAANGNDVAKLKQLLSTPGIHLNYTNAVRVVFIVLNERCVCAECNCRDAFGVLLLTGRRDCADPGFVQGPHRSSDPVGAGRCCIGH